jgi:hypothetical protein
MSTRESNVDFILNQGDKFDPTTVPGFEERDQNKEFEGLTPADIREKLLKEAESQDYHEEEAESMADEDRRREAEDDV